MGAARWELVGGSCQVGCMRIVARLGAHLVMGGARWDACCLLRWELLGGARWELVGGSW